MSERITENDLQQDMKLMSTIERLSFVRVQVKTNSDKFAKFGLEFYIHTCLRVMTRSGNDDTEDCIDYKRSRCDLFY